MTVLYHATVTESGSGNLSSAISSNTIVTLDVALSVTGLDTHLINTGKVLVAVYTDDPASEIASATIFSDGIGIYAKQNDGDETQSYFVASTITGSETISVSFNSVTDKIIVEVDDVEVSNEDFTAKWVNSLDKYQVGVAVVTGSFEAWVNYTPTLNTGIITEGYGLPNSIITEGYGAGSEVIPDPPDPPTSVYVVTVAAGLGGNTNVLPDTYNALSGSSFSITATPSTGYGFLYYDDGTNHIPSNPYIFTVSANVTLTPIYGISALTPQDRFGNLVSDIMTPAICDTAQADYTRADVTVPIFDGALEALVAKIPVETISGVKTLPTFRQALTYLKGE